MLPQQHFERVWRGILIDPADQRTIGVAEPGEERLHLLVLHLLLGEVVVVQVDLGPLRPLIDQHFGLGITGRVDCVEILPLRTRQVWLAVRLADRLRQRCAHPRPENDDNDVAGGRPRPCVVHRLLRRLVRQHRDVRVGIVPGDHLQLEATIGRVLSAVPPRSTRGQSFLSSATSPGDDRKIRTTGACSPLVSGAASPPRFFAILWTMSPNSERKLTRSGPKGTHSTEPHTRYGGRL